MKRAPGNMSMLLMAVTAAGAAACSRAPQLEIGSPADIDWRGWQTRTVTSAVTGQQYSYLYHPAAMSDAPRIVLLHGFTLDARTYVNMADLAQGYELYALHYPEASKLYKGGQSDLAIMVKDFVDSLGLDRFVLAGTSMGGITAMEFFKVKGETRVDALVIIDSVAFDSTPKDKKNRIRFARFMSKRSDGFLTKLVAIGINKAKKKLAKAGGPIDAQHDVFNIIGLKPADFYRQVVNVMLGYDGDSGQELVDCPTLVVHGRLDTTIPVGRTAYTLASIPQAKLAIVEGAGHDGVYTHGEEFAKIILDWLP